MGPGAQGFLFADFRALTMADHGTPHFHNDIGATTVHIGAKEFMCIGAKPPFDHPHIFLDMGRESEIVCSYCSTLYKFDPALKAYQARPAECVWERDPEPMTTR